VNSSEAQRFCGWPLIENKVYAPLRCVPTYCADYQCSHSIAVSADQWPDDLRLSDIEPQFECSACGKRGADIRPDFNWNKQPVKAMGYR
jgi:hypothetical protein